jgi:hypothetical protein
MVALGEDIRTPITVVVYGPEVVAVWILVNVLK